MKQFYASALLYDGKLKFWKISPNKRTSAYDFYKDFMYAGEDMRRYADDPLCTVETKSFEETDAVSNSDIFDRLAPEWFGQWELVENYKGQTPQSKPFIGTVVTAD